MSHDLDLPKDDRELSVGVEVGTPAFMPGGKVSMAFKRSWAHRANRYLEEVAVAANKTPDTVIDAIAIGDGFHDIFASGMRAAIDNGDASARHTFARLVATALKDDTKIDEVSLLLDAFSALPAPEMRFLWSFYLFVRDYGLDDIRDIWGMEPAGRTKDQRKEGQWLLMRLGLSDRGFTLLAKSLVHKGFLLERARPGSEFDGFEPSEIVLLALEILGDIDDEFARPSHWQPPA